MMKRNSRNGKIEFLRFVFALIIMLHHSRALVGDEQCIFLGGSLGVDFFFLVSGYLMMKTVEKMERVHGAPTAVGQETTQFLFNKIKAILPEHVVSFVIGFLVICILQRKGLHNSFSLLISSTWEFLLVKMSGITDGYINGVTWYISSMLLCMAILYPLLRGKKDITLHVIAPLCVLFLFGYLCQNYGDPRNPTKWLGFTYKGNVRCMAELCLGTQAYRLGQWLKDLKLRNSSRVLLTVFEFGTYIMAVLYMYYKEAKVLDYFVILMIAIALAITFSECGVGNGFFASPIFSKMGKFSVAIYFSHIFWARNLGRVLPESMSVRTQILVYAVISLFTACVVGALGNVLRKKWFQKEPTPAA